MPPYDLIFSSYCLHSVIRSFAFPFRMFTCVGGMSTVLRPAVIGLNLNEPWREQLGARTM